MSIAPDNSISATELRAPASMLLQTRNNSYEVLQPEPVIFGRVSVFLAARRVGDSQEVLIKSFRGFEPGDVSIAAFYREIDALRRLNHPNILEILDYDLALGGESPPFLVLPWCKGGNLARFRRQRDFIPIETAISFLRQIAAAIDYAHQNGIIHGDIKPQNVLLSEGFQHVYLTDFGMAKYFEVSDRVISRESPSEGTSAFLSPEQLNANKQTPLSDIYSFGVLAYQLLAGQMPYDISAPLYRQAHARVTGQVTDPRTANPNLSDTVRAGLMSALSVNPDERPSTATELCDILVGKRTAKRVQKRSGGRKLAEIWNDLDSTGKAAVVTAVVAGVGGIVTALVKIIPDLIAKK